MVGRVSCAEDAFARFDDMNEYIVAYTWPIRVPGGAVLIARVAYVCVFIDHTVPTHKETDFVNHLHDLQTPLRSPL